MAASKTIVRVIEDDQNEINIPVEVSTRSQSTHNESVADPNQQDERQVRFKPRLQSRRCGVMMVETLMPDNQTVRILQILDSPVDFSHHPAFVAGMNTFRQQCFGEKGRLYVTKDTEIPSENPERVVYFANIHTKTGAITGEKVFTKDEARVHLRRIREEIARWKEKLRMTYGQGNPEEFGTNVREAIRIANQTKDGAQQTVSN